MGSVADLGIKSDNADKEEIIKTLEEWIEIIRTSDGFAFHGSLVAGECELEGCMCGGEGSRAREIHSVNGTFNSEDLDDIIRALKGFMINMGDTVSELGPGRKSRKYDV